MMRNVAIGAVLGFGLVVLVLSLFNNAPPPPAPAPAPTPAPAPAPVAAAAPAPEPAPAADADGGPVPVLMPLNTAPVVVMPSQAVGRGEVMKAFARERAAAAWNRDAGP